MQTLSKNPSRARSITVTKTMRQSSTVPDAIEMLIEDHKNVKKLFKEFEKLSKKNDIKGKVEVAKRICDELTIHTKLEEEIFYPAIREATREEDLLNEAEVEHASAKKFISQIQDITGTHPMYDAKVKVLSEYIDHHVKEEETEMFPKARKAKIDLDFFGIVMRDRKKELQTKPN